MPKDSLIESYWDAFDKRNKDQMQSCAEKLSVDELEAAMSQHYELGTARIPDHAWAMNFLGEILEGKIKSFESWLNAMDREVEYLKSRKRILALTPEQVAIIQEYDEKANIVLEYRKSNF